MPDFGMPLPEGIVPELDEQDLVQGLRAGREASVELFLERYRPLFYHCIGHFETENAAREDLYQEVVVYVLERFHQDCFDAAKGSFGTWLYRVAWCRCVDLKRKQGARRNPKLVPVGDQMPERIDQSLGPGDIAGQEEIGGLVRRGMASLEPEERTLLVLRFVDGRTIGEISEEMAISLEQAKYRLKRASTSLRRVLLNEFALEEATE
jgi:RNA polymerase sigma-70 factor (ECF subfamily)